MLRRFSPILAGILLLMLAPSSPADARHSRHPSHHRPHHSSRHLAKRPIVGWYTSTGVATTDTHLSSYAQVGMKLVVAYNDGNPTHLDSFLARAQAAGVKVLIQPDMSWAQTGDLSLLRDFIIKYRSSPAIYGWYLDDEPDFTGLAPTRLHAAYELVRSLDYHPAAVVFTLGDCSPGHGPYMRYLNSFDLLMFDDYPFYRFVRGETASKMALQEVRSAARHCVATAHRYHKLGPIMVIQGFGNGVKDGPFYFRDPTYREENIMFTDSVKAGATGVVFWDDTVADGWVRHNVLQIVGRWRGLRVGRSYGLVPQLRIKGISRHRQP